MYERVLVRPIFCSDRIRWVGRFDDGGAVIFTQPTDEFKEMVESGDIVTIPVTAWFDPNTGYYSFEHDPDYPDMEREVCAAEYLEER